MQRKKVKTTVYFALALFVVALSVVGLLVATNQTSVASNGAYLNRISGQIVSQSNKPARLGAAVHICGNACFEATTSIINGTFSVSDIPPGHYAVYGEQKSCKSLEYTLSITERETIGIPFALILDQCS